LPKAAVLITTYNAAPRSRNSFPSSSLAPLRQSSAQQTIRSS
jgi:hypothetical protein